MADEHVLKVETHIPVNFTCATDTTVEKGAACKMTDGMVAILSDGDVDIPAGVVQSEKLAAETSQNSVSIFRGGIFTAVAGAAGVTFGQAITTDVATSSENRLVNAAANDNNIWGICLETAATGVRFLYELRPTIINAT
ncbi:hypothetical protein LCGC14_3081700 [marine sediment metagenome]|uniref:Uncharacterized protein n=1 Tax=marine sediment metagenome TaxID=412755 RepID=A0A0F8Z3R8_9ZZZZ